MLISTQLSFTLHRDRKCGKLMCEIWDWSAEKYPVMWVGDLGFESKTKKARGHSCTALLSFPHEKFDEVNQLYEASDITDFPLSDDLLRVPDGTKCGKGRRNRKV
jgi:hypothetical protein